MLHMIYYKLGICYSGCIIYISKPSHRIRVHGTQYDYKCDISKKKKTKPFPQLLYFVVRKTENGETIVCSTEAPFLFHELT